MNETRKLAPGIHDNHGLKLWHEWQAIVSNAPVMAGDWRYERDETGAQLAGPGECLTRMVGNVAVRVILGDGRYTPLAEMADRHGAPTSGPGRVLTSVSPPRQEALFPALALAEEAASQIGKPNPPGRQGRR